MAQTSMKEPHAIIHKYDFVIKDTVAFYQGRVICLCDVFYDLSMSMTKNEVARKYGFKRKFFPLIFRETARFYSVLTYPKYKKKALESMALLEKERKEE